MIITATSTIVFDPATEYMDSIDFAEKNPEYKLVSETTTARIYERKETVQTVYRKRAKE